MLAGSPGNNFAQATCRYDSSLGKNFLHKLMFDGNYFFG